MRIGINARFLIDGKMEGFGWYSYEVTKRLIEQHPEHEFILFFDRAFSKKFEFGKNSKGVIIQPPARHPILFMIWFDLAIPRALKKHKIDVFYSPDGYLSLRTKTPQIATIHDINFEHFPEDLPFTARKYLKFFFPKFARKAAQIITVSNYSKEDLVTTYAIPPKKITVAWNGASDVFIPVNDYTKELVKKIHTNGKEYFLFVGSLHPRKNIPRLLKAFEKYCQTSKENWDLVIVGEALWDKSVDFNNVSETFEQRVHFTGRLSLEELATIVGAAGALAYVPYFEGFGIPLVEAMKCGVPIIAGNLTSLPEVAGDAAIYCNPFDVEDIANALFTISEDNELRVRLKQNGLNRSSLFSWDKSADIVWQEIQKFQ